MGFLKNRGYNLKERAYVWAGGIVGAAAPIVAGRMIVGPTRGVGGELFAWGVSVVANASTMLVAPHAPFPFYTGMAGTALGMFAANSSKKAKRRKQWERAAYVARDRGHEHALMENLERTTLGESQ